jgi:hypothetical protein
MTNSLNRPRASTELENDSSASISQWNGLNTVISCVMFSVIQRMIMVSSLTPGITKP